MKNILEAFYDGTLNPSEEIFQNDKQYRNYLGRQCKSSEKLFACLNREQWRLFEDYLDRKNQTEDYVHHKVFRCGFQLGARLLIELRL